MNGKAIRKTVLRKLEEYGYESDESLLTMDSVTYLSLIVDLEEVFKIEFPDHTLTSNALKDIDTFVKVIDTIMTSKRTLKIFGRQLKVVFGKNYKAPEPDPALFKSNEVSQLRYGAITFVVFLLSTVLNIFISVLIPKRYALYFKDVMISKLGAVFTILLIVILIVFAAIMTMVCNRQIGRRLQAREQRW
jgi:acyl carrier protein